MSSDWPYNFIVIAHAAWFGQQVTSSEKLQTKRDSKPRPLDYLSNALTTELFVHKVRKFVNLFNTTLTTEESTSDV